MQGCRLVPKGPRKTFLDDYLNVPTLQKTYPPPYPLPLRPDEVCMLCELFASRLGCKLYLEAIATLLATAHGFTAPNHTWGNDAIHISQSI